MTTARPNLLCVHGAWVGAWEFAPAVEILRERGWMVDTIELPSTGSTENMSADAEAVTAALDAMDAPAILLGHSYGGIPVTQAGAHPAVERLVYVAAFALDTGESLLSSLGGTLPEFWHVEDEQVFLGPTREARVAMVAADLPPGAPPEAAEALADMFRPQSLASFREPLTQAAWRSKPATYILTENDRLVPPAFQEQLAIRVGAQVERIPTGHAPFQENPARFATLIELIADLPAS